MSDYEATAYLSLEKLKVIYDELIFLGKAHVGISIILRKNPKRITIKNEIFKGSFRTSWQRIKISKSKAIRRSRKNKDESRSFRRIWTQQIRSRGKWLIYIFKMQSVL